MAANAKIDYWWIVCDCDNDKECHKCKGVGLVYPDRCPVHYYDHEVKYLRLLYDAYNDKNILPFSGSLIEQPKILFETFKLINYYKGLRLNVNSKEFERAEDMLNKIGG